MAEEYGIRIRGQANPIPVNLEPLIWYWLREIAAERGIPLSHLAEEIDRDYRLTTDRHGREKVITLSSAIRTFVTEHIASRAVSARQSAASRARPGRQARGKVG